MTHLSDYLQTSFFSCSKMARSNTGDLFSGIFLDTKTSKEVRNAIIKILNDISPNGENALIAKALNFWYKELLHMTTCGKWKPDFATYVKGLELGSEKRLDVLSIFANGRIMAVKVRGENCEGHLTIALNNDPSINPKVLPAEAGPLCQDRKNEIFLFPENEPFRVSGIVGLATQTKPEGPFGPEVVPKANSGDWKKPSAKPNAKPNAKGNPNGQKIMPDEPEKSQVVKARADRLALFVPFPPGCGKSFTVSVVASVLEKLGIINAQFTQDDFAVNGRKSGDKSKYLKAITDKVQEGKTTIYLFGSVNGHANARGKVLELLQDDTAKHYFVLSGKPEEILKRAVEGIKGRPHHPTLDKTTPDIEQIVSQHMRDIDKSFPDFKDQMTYIPVSATREEVAETVLTTILSKLGKDFDKVELKKHISTAVQSQMTKETQLLNDEVSASAGSSVEHVEVASSANTDE